VYNPGHNNHDLQQWLLTGKDFGMVLELKTPFLNSIVTGLVPLLLIVATACLYFWYLGTFAVNIPQGDDIQDVLTA
jgi:hypothetical protein